MLKKRLIFTLLYRQGSFMLSRNFRLQKVGNIEWLYKNYHFESISDAIDELVILNVDSDRSSIADFHQALTTLVKHCMIPVAAGGQIRSVEDGQQLIAHGADKLVLNTPCFNDRELVNHLADIYGSQCIVAAADWKPVKSKNNSEITAYEPTVFSHNAGQQQSALPRYLEYIQQLPVGELYLNAIHKDGTGQGFDFSPLKNLPKNWNLPITYAGGAGQTSHFKQAFECPEISAAATANLFNFIAGGLAKSRNDLLTQGVNIADFNSSDFINSPTQVA